MMKSDTEKWHSLFHSTFIKIYANNRNQCASTQKTVVFHCPLVSISQICENKMSLGGHGFSVIYASILGIPFCVIDDC